MWPDGTKEYDDRIVSDTVVHLIEMDRSRRFEMRDALRKPSGGRQPDCAAGRQSVRYETIAPAAGSPDRRR